ncbi:secreted RxLR effector protein 161-like [Rutidosis leptorrhynchoides]|uniref:secreted RxLR effector protein 161-like n=1 Tax=Rutidosis leptorrhynchoides TaxID=125765 RepID=UPI003A98D2C3
MVMVRTIISLAAYKGCKLWQLDMKNAFLYGELDREVFMEQLIGFTSQAKRILCYVKGSIGHSLWYKKYDNVLLKDFVDAYWMGDANDRRSTSGYCFNMGSAVISWCSKKQDVVALSRTEAEYIAATMAAQECTWLRRLIGDIYLKK